jgi:hypothetical protein
MYGDAACQTATQSTGAGSVLVSVLLVAVGYPTMFQPALSMMFIATDEFAV